MGNRTLAAYNGTVEDREREERVLNIFTVVNFPNSACNASNGNEGVCYAATECISLGGTSSGTCASGFGVCCLFSGGCGSSTVLNNTYFNSGNSDTSACTFEVCKTDSSICHIRLDFDTFEIAGPSTANTGTNPTMRSRCLTASFSASTQGGDPTPLCGTNTGYHMYLEPEDGCNTLEFSWLDSSTDSRSWSIQVAQIECNKEWSPPQGCTQYFTGVSGTIVSYNFQGGSHLADHDYQNCIRTEQGYCSITYTGSTFQVGDGTQAATSKVGSTCSLDWITIPFGGSTTSSVSNKEKYCGTFLNPTDGIGTAAVVLSNVQPFKVGVHFDGTESNNPAAESTVGFSLSYSQSKTC